jgi:proteasome lid subunit RPN8/RPN11
MSLDRPEYSISLEQARINIAAAQEAIDYARAHGLKVLPHWLETIRQNEQRLEGTALLNGGTRPQRSRSRSLEPSARVASRRPKWHLRSSEPTARHVRSANEAPELLETGSGFTIQICVSACGAIEREALEAIWQFDSRVVESGGYLYALYPSNDERALIVHASGPGRNGDHGPGRVRLSDPSDVESDFGELEARAGLVLCGDWHSEPGRDPIPSDADLVAWANNSDRAGILPYASIIATPGEIGWTTPELHGWVTREDEDGFLVCEPAKVLDG